MITPQTIRELPVDHDRFKQESLQRLGNQLSELTYPGYPDFTDRLVCEDPSIDLYEAITQPGSHWTEDPDKLVVPVINNRNGYDIDANGMMVHPWFKEMARAKTIGVLAGKGFYYNYGENETCDPIVIRLDLDEPHVHIIERGDTGKLALPGGFRDNEENPLLGSVREYREETGDKLDPFNAAIVTDVFKVYEGVLADLRVTAHAWPKTYAYGFILNPDYSKTLPLGRLKAHDDATWKEWKPASELDNLFGSHSLLARLALGK